MSEIPSSLSSDERLIELLNQSRKRKLTADEFFEQKVSWVYGNMKLSGNSDITKAEVRKRLDAYQ